MKDISPLEQLYNEQLYHETIRHVNDLPDPGRDFRHPEGFRGNSNEKVNKIASQMLNSSEVKVLRLFYTRVSAVLGKDAFFKWFENK